MIVPAEQTNRIVASGRRRSAQMFGITDPTTVSLRSARERDRARAGHNGGLGRLSRTESICISTSFGYRSFFFCGCSCQVALYHDRGSHEPRGRSRTGRITNCHVAFFRCRRCEGFRIYLPTVAEAYSEDITTTLPGWGADCQKAADSKFHGLFSQQKRRRR
jgi:hypothetical protein